MLAQDLFDWLVQVVLEKEGALVSAAVAHDSLVASFRVADVQEVRQEVTDLRTVASAERLADEGSESVIGCCAFIGQADVDPLAVALAVFSARRAGEEDIGLGFNS